MKIKLDTGAYLPEKAHKADAGYDLRTPKTVGVPSGGHAAIDTGVHIEIPEGYYGKLESKSGLNVKHGVVSLGGVIDSGYTGSIVAVMYNFGHEDYIFSKGDKVVQLIIQPCMDAEFTLVPHLDETDRGNNGFGSTGK